MDSERLKKLQAGGAKVWVASDKKQPAILEEQINAMLKKHETRMDSLQNALVEAIAHLNTRAPNVRVDPSQVTVNNVPPRVARINIERDSSGYISALVPVYKSTN